MKGATKVLVLALCLAMAAFHASAQTLCTSDDYDHDYTTCRGGFRNAIYFKKAGSTCQGGVPIPENVYFIACDIVCQPGEYLPFGKTTSADCTKCSEGEYSLGGGLRITKWQAPGGDWGRFSPSPTMSFRTWCIDTRFPDIIIPDRVCPGWKLVNGSYAASGEEADDYQVSILEMTVNLVHNGEIKFEYRVDSEVNYDAMSFDVDNKQVLGPISSQIEYTSKTFPLDRGLHTLRWKYTKDFSLSSGEDQAFLKLIEITGTDYADSQCLKCPIGTQANYRGATYCDLCEPNTFSDQEGTRRCEACPVTEFSYPGSTSCTPREPCIKADYYEYYTVCDNGRRSKYYDWLSPRICDNTAQTSVVLPADELDIPCAPCNPGTQRDPTTGVCTPCPTNMYSAGKEESCQTCGTGTVGRRDFIWKTFQEMPVGVEVKPSCTGTCGSTEWRLNNDHYDSGVGHGEYVDIQFSLPITVEGPGTIRFNVTFACRRLCYIRFIDEVTRNGQTEIVRTRSYYNFGSYAPTFDVIPGEHTFTWAFQQYDPYLESRDDRAQIWEISVTNVGQGQGGADRCTSCTPGTRADPVAASCLACPPGSTSVALATQCTQCEPNTFAELGGSPFCDNCGFGTTAGRGASECTTDCVYTPEHSISYDLRGLQKTLSMWGPIYDNGMNPFYLNICSKQNGNSTCLDDENVPISTYACKLDRNGHGIDVGHNPAFSGGGAGSGSFNVTYTDGEPGCPTGWFGDGMVPQQTTVSFICDPDAGEGSPVAASPFEITKCHYHFKWYTIHACRACDDQDIDYYYTDCVNKKQDKIFYWRDNPKQCHGGKTLSPPERDLTCVPDDEVFCPAGEHKVEECEACDPGTFSVGGGIVVDTWASLPVGFSSLCSAFNPACSQWVPFGSYIEGASHGSVLQTIVNLIAPGNVTFSYQATLAQGASFTFVVDSGLVIENVAQSTTGLQRYAVQLPIGSHILQWTLVAPQSSGSSIHLHRIQVTGIRRHDKVCFDCPIGCYQNTTSATTCAECPLNTYSDSRGRASCKPCDQGTWAPVGSDRCYPVVACTIENYYPTWSSCRNGKRTKHYLAKQPKTCVGAFAPPADTTEDCYCAPGTRLDSTGACVACATGQTWDSTDQRCKNVPPGQVVTLQATVVGASLQIPSPDASPLYTELTTGCVGVCDSAWFYASTGGRLNSGKQFGPASSYLSVETFITNKRTGEFSYEHSITGSGNLQVLVDGILVRQSTTRSTSASTRVPLSYGKHVITFNFVSKGTGGDHVTLENLTVFGAQFGSPVVQECTDGYHSSKPGSTECEPCQPGTFSGSLLPGSAGVSQCTPCEPNTFTGWTAGSVCERCSATSSSPLGGTLCTSGCRFNTSSLNYDLRRLAERPFIVSEGQRQFYISLCQPLNTTECPLGTHICGTQTSADPTDYGRNFDVALPSTENGEIKITFAQGSLCAKGYRRKSTVKLVCSAPDAQDLGQPRLIRTDADGCDTEFEWKTAAACKACEFSDLKAVMGKCTSGKQAVSYIAPATCYNSGLDLPPIEEKPCSEVEFPLYAVIGALAAFVILVIVLVVFFIKNRRLEQEYTLLRDAHSDQIDTNLELSTALDTELEEEDNRRL